MTCEKPAKRGINPKPVQPVEKRYSDTADACPSYLQEQQNLYVPKGGESHRLDPQRDGSSDQLSDPPQLISRWVKFERSEEREINSADCKIELNCTGHAIDKICAIKFNFKMGRSHAVSDDVHRLVTQSIRPATQRAYISDLRDFRAWGGDIPSAPERLAAYLAEQAKTRKVATISRRLASISMAHEAGGYANPTKAALVQATMRGIRRTIGTAQRQARALLRDDLFAVLDRLADRPKDIRDRCLLLLGFATAMRRSELVALNVGDVAFVAKGALVTIRRSKTDQEGEGRKIAVPFGRTRHCPAGALKDWLTFAGIETGPIFLGINKHGHVLDHRISGEAVSHVVKSRLSDAGYEPENFSGHSLRSGFATSAAEAGASFHKIKQATGHRSDLSLARYLHDVDLFHDAAAAKIL